MRSYSHLNSAAAILASYNGNEPFHLYIKKYFASNKKFGSKDRKQIASLCYNYFRIGHAVKNISVEDRILLAIFLCETQPSEFFKSLRPEWNDLIDKPLEEKLSIVNLPAGRQGHQFSIKDIFPFKDELSEGIDPNKFSLSFLVQPDLFLRIRPGYHKKVTGKLAVAGLPYKLISKDCIVLPNASKVDAVIELDQEAVVQDYNSQRVGEFISAVRRGPSDRVWDCCAASGGKSIMAYDINPIIELTVSDKRASILDNMHKRFATAGIKNYKSFVADLSTDNYQLPTNKFDHIICDVPCTGSGTWARTPEQLFYFRKEQIEKYATLQKQIMQKVIPHLKKGGHLLYITCSVFKKENEDIVAFVQEDLHLTLIKREILKGYEIKADTMFAALFTVPAT